MIYKLIEDDKSRGKLFIPYKYMSDNDFENGDLITVSAGLKKESVEVVFDDELRDGEVMISADISESLAIPTEVNYQIAYDEGSVKIGPVIGLLMSKSHYGLKRGRLSKLLNYCRIYTEIGGLIIAFSVDNIDFEKKVVKGYYYNPIKNDHQVPWKEGIFPLPDSIFQRTSIPDGIRRRLQRETNNRMFNSNYFNKLDFWNILSQDEAFLECIPDTRSFRSIDDLDYMLEKYNAVYLKPAHGTLSRGLYRVTKNDYIYSFQGKIGTEVTQTFSVEETEDYLNSIVGRNIYIVQQAIRPLMINGRHLDFRVIMQKDHTLSWGCTGIVGFVGGQGDICTNWGYTANFEDTLKRHFDFTQKDIFRKKQEVVKACENVCRALESTGENYGDLGFDVVIDENLKVWVLEANKRHYHSVPLWIDDKQTFYKIKTNIIKYATALAGFKVYNS
jgi:hypothetical protein